MIRRHVAKPNNSPFRIKRLAQSKLAGWAFNSLLADDPFAVKARTAIVKSARQWPVLKLVIIAAHGPFWPVNSPLSIWAELWPGVFPAY